MNRERPIDTRPVGDVPCDSTADTQEHRRKVADFLGYVAGELACRARTHDASKLGPEEKSHFDELTPSLRGSTFGSETYARSLRELKPALDHHYLINPHHPEHYLDGVDGMSLFDITEMFADWVASAGRHENGDFYQSLADCAKRYTLAPQLVNIFRNTAKRMGLKEENSTA